MVGSRSRCQRIDCGVMTDDRKRRVSVAMPFQTQYQYTYGTDAAQFMSWHTSPVAVDVVLCDACALALGATEIKGDWKSSIDHTWENCYGQKPPLGEESILPCGQPECSTGYHDKIAGCGGCSLNRKFGKESEQR